MSGISRPTSHLPTLLIPPDETTRKWTISAGTSFATVNSATTGGSPSLSIVGAGRLPEIVGRIFAVTPVVSNRMALASRRLTPVIVTRVVAPGRPPRGKTLRISGGASCAWEGQAKRQRRSKANRRIDALAVRAAYSGLMKFYSRAGRICFLIGFRVGGFLPGAFAKSGRI